jgi:hypothetical protein
MSQRRGPTYTDYGSDAPAQRLRADGKTPLMVVGDAMFWTNRQAIVDLINAAGVPALYPERGYAESGGLTAYGAYVPDNFRAAAGGLVTEAATGFQPRWGRCREPTPITPHYAPFPTFKAAGCHCASHRGSGISLARGVRAFRRAGDWIPEQSLPRGICEVGRSLCEWPARGRLC